MKISYSWLQDYISIDAPLHEVTQLLTDGGLEIEGVEMVEKIKGGLSGLVVGEVMSCEKHPDADKLKVTRVDVGGEELLQVVCGAPNVAQGQKVVVATVGTTLYPGGDESAAFKIKKSKIRGVESFGMLCAEDEIGVGESHDGIIVLLGDYEVGTEVSKVYGMEPEVVLEVGLTPNRVDAASHYGVARDLKALLNVTKRNQGDVAGSAVEAKLADVEAFAAGEDTVAVRVENNVAAPRYMGVVIRDVKVAPSPEWLQNRLQAIGINPKNNVVDITNFVLHECGQPLHAFDFDKIEGGEVVVRNAAKGEEFVTLDGVKRKLEEDDLMICDATKPMCIAGVLGGENSGVSDATTSVFLESAYFNPAWVRRTAKRHTISTDASWRYERGADPNILPYALKRAALLICELAGGRVSSEVADIYAEKIEPFAVEVDVNRINALIGKQLDAELVEAILGELEIEIVSKNGSKLMLAVPPYRVDVTREADITEEILRIYGFNNVENPPYLKSVIANVPQNSIDKFVGLLSEMLVSLGFTEIMSNSLTKAAYYEKLEVLNLDRAVKIQNPLSSDLSVMRQTLVFNALEAIALNSARKRSDLKLFEVGNCYSVQPDAEGTSDELAKYKEDFKMCLAMVGNTESKNWNAKGESADYYAIKSVVEQLFARIGVDMQSRVKIVQNTAYDLFDSLSALYTLPGREAVELLTIGKVRSQHIEMLDIKPRQDVFVAEINLEPLYELYSKRVIKFKEISKYQSVKRDLSLLIDQSITYAELREAAIKAERKLLREVSIFDLYQGDKLPAGKKSYALSFTLEDGSKTLTDSDIEGAMARITKALLAMGGELR